MAKVKQRYICQECGYVSPQWLGKCPDCGSWGSLVEEAVAPSATNGKSGRTTSAASPLAAPALATPIGEVPEEEQRRITSSFHEVDRVLGGGFVPGSLILLSGDPGIGKSTLTMQIMDRAAFQGTVLYVSAEESKGQIASRAKRLGVATKDLLVITESHLPAIEAAIEKYAPAFLVIDSIQTVHDPSLQSATGSVSQLRSITAHAMLWAKDWGIPTILIGHVTKDGNVAGPRVLEHMVDTVLYFEGDRQYRYRVLRALKNRFGSTNEIGLFDMQKEGLVEVSNASAAFLAERPNHASGTAVAALMEGSRPILVEIQALASKSFLNQPRRVSSGCDYNRMAMLLAVLEKRVGMAFSDKDVYVNVIGGLRLNEPASDLAVAMAMASQVLDKPLPPEAVFIGEVGLTGEVRSVTQIERRLKEAYNLGFTEAFIPYNRQLQNSKKMQLHPVRHLKDILKYL